MFNRQQEALYMEDPNRCPICGSDDIEAGDSRQLNDDTLERDMECIECGKEWQEYYKLTGIGDE